MFGTQLLKLRTSLFRIKTAEYIHFVLGTNLWLYLLYVDIMTFSLFFALYFEKCKFSKTATL